LPVKAHERPWHVDADESGEWIVEAPRAREVPPHEIVFSHLLLRWRASTALMSSLTDMLLHPDYQAIIGLGPVAIPLLLREFAREPDHFAWALASITREDPTDPSMAGDVEAQARAWLAWGRERGYLG